LEEEDDEIEIPEEELVRGGGGFDPTLCLIGRFLSSKQVITHMMKEHMKGIWSLVKGVEIREIKKGVFMFEFFHQ